MKSITVSKKIEVDHIWAEGKNGEFQSAKEKMQVPYAINCWSGVPHLRWSKQEDPNHPVNWYLSSLTGHPFCHHSPTSDLYLYPCNPNHQLGGPQSYLQSKEAPKPTHIRRTPSNLLVTFPNADASFIQSYDNLVGQPHLAPTVRYAPTQNETPHQSPPSYTTQSPPHISNPIANWGNSKFQSLPIRMT